MIAAEGGLSGQGPPGSAPESPHAASGDRPRDHPFMLPDQTGPCKPLPLECRHCSVEQKRPRDLTVVGILGVALDPSAAQARDLCQGARQRRLRDTLAAMTLARKKAGDAPIG